MFIVIIDILFDNWIKPSANLHIRRFEICTSNRILNLVMITVVRTARNQFGHKTCEEQLRAQYDNHQGDVK